MRMGGESQRQPEAPQYSRQPLLAVSVAWSIADHGHANPSIAVAMLRLVPRSVLPAGKKNTQPKAT